MSFAGKLARGLLSGAAAYEGKVAEQQEYDRRSSILAEREAALKQVEAQAQAARDDKLHANAIDLAKTTAQAQADARVSEVKRTDTTKRRQMWYASGLRIEESDAASDNRVREAHDALKLDIQRYEKQNKIKLNEMQVADAYQAARDAANDGRKVSFQGQDDAGNLVIGYGDNRVSTVEGVKPKAGESMFGGMPGGSGIPSTASPATAAPRPIKVTTTGGDTAPAGDKTYTMAEIRASAKLHGVSVEDAIRQAKGAGYRLTN